MRRVAALVVVAAACAGVVLVAGACSPSFLPSSFVNESRVIAITAEPPEATPGAHVTLTPFVVDVAGDLSASSPSTPAGTQATYDASWWRCPDSDSDALGDDDQCTDPSTEKTIGTGSPYIDTVPVDLFGDLSQAAQDPSQLHSDKILGAILGYYRVVGFTMETQSAPGQVRIVDGFKREPVYLPGHLGAIDPRLAAIDSHVDDKGNDIAPNANPTLSAVSIHEDTVDGGTTTKLSRSKSYFFQPIFDDASLQAYISLKVDLSGLDLSDPATIKAIPLDQLVKRFSKVQRCEIPTFSWFVTAGKVERDNTLDEGVIARVFDPQGVDCPPIEGEARRPEVKYTPPTNASDDPEDRIPASGVVHAWVVMRDGRGGTAVRSFDFHVE